MYLTSHILTFSHLTANDRPRDDNRTVGTGSSFNEWKERKDGRKDGRKGIIGRKEKGWIGWGKG